MTSPTSPPFDLIAARAADLTPAQRLALLLWRGASDRVWEDCLAEALAVHPPPPCRLARVDWPGTQAEGCALACAVCACGANVRVALERRDTGWHVRPNNGDEAHGPVAHLLGEALTRLEDEQALAHVQGLQDGTPGEWLRAFAESKGWQPS